MPDFETVPRHPVFAYYLKIRKFLFRKGHGRYFNPMSLLGPISITHSENTQINKLRWFLNIGFTF